MRCGECNAEFPWHVEGCVAERRMIDKAAQREREGACLLCGSKEPHNRLLCDRK